MKLKRRLYVRANSRRIRVRNNKKSPSTSPSLTSHASCEDACLVDLSTIETRRFVEKDGSSVPFSLIDGTWWVKWKNDTSRRRGSERKERKSIRQKFYQYFQYTRVHAKILYKSFNITQLLLPGAERRVGNASMFLTTYPTRIYSGIIPMDRIPRKKYARTISRSYEPIIRFLLRRKRNVSVARCASRDRRSSILN